jgi:hypothetical protein
LRGTPALGELSAWQENGTASEAVHLNNLLRYCEKSCELHNQTCNPRFLEVSANSAPFLAEDHPGR